MKPSERIKQIIEIIKMEHPEVYMGQEYYKNEAIIRYLDEKESKS